MLISTFINQEDLIKIANAITKESSSKRLEKARKRCQNCQTRRRKQKTKGAKAIRISKVRFGTRIETLGKLLEQITRRDRRQENCLRQL